MSAPWELLLPSEAGDPLLVLGTLDAETRGMLAGRRLVEDVARAPFSAVLIVPGGPRPGVAEAARLFRYLIPGGALLWWTPRSRATPSSDAERWLAGGRSLWRAEADWAAPLESSGKLDQVRSLLGRARPASHELWRVLPDASHDNAWLSEVFESIAGGGGPRLTLGDLGRIDCTRTGLAIVRLRHARSGVVALKVPSDERSRLKLPYETRVLETLRAAGHSNKVVAALPAVLASGEHAERAWRLESWIAGEPASRLMYRTAERERVVDAALAWLVELHRRDPGVTLSASREAAHARTVLAGLAQRIGIDDRGFADDVARYLEQALARDGVRAVQGHGDFWLGNLIVDPLERSIAGVVDWTWAEAAAAPFGDALHLLAYRKGWLSTYAPAKCLAELLEGRGAAVDRRRLGTYARATGLAPRVLGALALAHWVRYLDTRADYLAELRENFAKAYLPVRGSFERLGPRGLEAWGEALPAG